MRALKILLFVMALPIIGGFVFIGVVLYHRLANPENRAPFTAEAPAAPAPTVVTQLGLPAGARFGQPVPVGNRIAVTATLPDGGDRLYLIDPRTGAVAAIVIGSESPIKP